MFDCPGHAGISLAIGSTSRRAGGVVPQNIIRRGTIGAVSAKATKRTEPEPSPALPTAQYPRARHGICLCAAQCAQLKLMPEVRCGTEALAQAARRV